MKIQFTLALVLTASTLFAQKFIGHRGASYLAPENTVASANLAWESGADAVEIDVYLTKDNRVMVIHDKDTKRTCTGKKNLTIKDTPSVLLRDLDAGSWKGAKYAGEKIPFFSEILETVPEGKTLVVEIKCGSEILPHLERVLEKSGKAEQVVFISFGWNTILDTHKAFPENNCYWLSSSKMNLKNKMEQAAEAGLTGVNLHYKITDEETVKEAHALGLEVLAWTVDDPAEAQRLFEMGVKSVTTNRPAWLKEQVAGL